MAVMYLEINSSSAEMVPKLHSFSISINRLQNSGVSFSDCFAQNKSPLLLYLYVVLGRSVRYITGLDLYF